MTRDQMQQHRAPAVDWFDFVSRAAGLPLSTPVPAPPPPTPEPTR